MGASLFIVDIIWVIVAVAKDKKTDYNCRDYARKIGSDKYASSTGLRYMDSNKLVYDIKDIGKK